MENFYELHNLKFKIEKEAVLKAIDCYEDSPVYEEVADVYEEIYKDMVSLVEPVGILGFGTLPESVETEKYKAGTPVVYMVMSIGNGIKEESTKAFREGDYVKGMLTDAMADDALFSMEEQILARLKEVCREHNAGVIARLEAPYDISMESQKAAWEHLELKRRFGIDISSGFMFDPVKTSCQVFVLTDNTESFNAQHDCRKCPNIHCRIRNIPDTEVVVRRGQDTKVILVKEGESLLDAFIRQRIYLSAPCGGKGRCGKCGVQVLKGNTWISDEDKKTYSQKELDAGWRLSCCLYPVEELEVSILQSDESLFEAVGETGTKGESCTEEAFYNVSADIGTTTIAMSLVGGESGQVLSTVTSVNSQRVYGADVISRIQASVEGKKEELQRTIQKDLQECLEKILREKGLSGEQIKTIVISGNTTMEHLLMGYDCDTLGVYPFTPVNIDFIKGTEEILGTDKFGKKEIILLPGISAYVGGDIVSGMYAHDFTEKEKVCMFIDLGTNGEMGIGNKEKILVTSTAAGPAFEGGNIIWGMGSVPGAICSVKLNGTEAEVKTIRDEAPQGLCGTGVVETAAELVREEIADETGALDEDYFDDGFPLAETPDGKEIVFTQKDMREIQLAKAAVRAGVETLLLRYGVKKEDVSKVYLAGGFGYKLNTDMAIEIGMIPKEWADRITAVGNSSLSGASKYLKDKNGDKKMENLVSISEEINLSADKVFNEFYMSAMFFEI